MTWLNTESVNWKKAPGIDKKCRAKKQLEKILVVEDKKQIFVDKQQTVFIGVF